MAELKKIRTMILLFCGLKFSQNEIKKTMLLKIKFSSISSMRFLKARIFQTFDSQKLLCRNVLCHVQWPTGHLVLHYLLMTKAVMKNPIKPIIIKIFERIFWIGIKEID